MHVLVYNTSHEWVERYREVVRKMSSTVVQVHPLSLLLIQVMHLSDGVTAVLQVSGLMAESRAILQ